MIHEWRTYQLKPGATGEYLALLADLGLPLVTRHLPLLGYWQAETGPLNVIHHLWTYADWAEREACRAALSNEEAWVNGFIPQAFPMVLQQHNYLATLGRGSPVFDTAVADRHRQHGPRPAGTPLFAPDCAGLVTGHVPPDAVALLEPFSGSVRGPLALLPRHADPLRFVGGYDGQHTVLRPLSFSPL
ncbi:MULTISPECIES: NIPSNAP family protein [unclassified Rhizobium]|uniref:NIPSNAP family protein n=1 Tax=unclassified Rhizobium TaxID=2613769 RepID=UPI001AE17155|nr:MULTISPECIES: NIPSNAP family protein [unclassified Rhizobium]MBP2459726.1 hypothetical protein [Rhizobium sp. PvP014]MBP2531084.1 hypothetical protein [Rhizobium sp. PvP099]